MEFYSAIKKKEILSSAGKWLGLENIILSKVTQLRRPKTVCPLSYADFRPKTNAVILSEMGHMLREEHIQEE
jgi:hypothetical protein